jgi:DnaK suppressor protein
MDPERARQLLVGERERLTRRLRGRTPQPTNDPTPTDPADRASDVFEAELDEGLADRLAEELAAVERAEARLAAGTYGLSVESGQAIPDERLEVLPAAERTAEEQARFEHGV